MEKLLVVSATDIKASLLLGAQNVGRFDTHTATNGAQARRMILQTDYKLILINAPLKDELGIDFAITAASSTSAGVVVLVDVNIFDFNAAKAEGYGVFAIPKPISAERARDAVRFALSTANRLSGMKTQYVMLQQKLEEIKVVDRAKCVLMQYLNMTEEQAHKYIERHAMDSRQSRYEVAKGILTGYEG